MTRSWSWLEAMTNLLRVGAFCKKKSKIWDLLFHVSRRCSPKITRIFIEFEQDGVASEDDHFRHVHSSNSIPSSPFPKSHIVLEEQFRILTASNWSAILLICFLVRTVNVESSNFICEVELIMRINRIRFFAAFSPSSHFRSLIWAERHFLMSCLVFPRKIEPGMPTNEKFPPSDVVPAASNSFWEFSRVCCTDDVTFRIWISNQVVLHLSDNMTMHYMHWTYEDNIWSQRERCQKKCSFCQVAALRISVFGFEILAILIASSTSHYANDSEVPRDLSSPFGNIVLTVINVHKRHETEDTSTPKLRLIGQVVTTLLYYCTHLQFNWLTNPIALENDIHDHESFPLYLAVGRVHRRLHQ